MNRVVRADEQGMILVNVLMFVAIASGLVLLMINREELALDRALRVSEAARAMAVVRGGEASAVTALRRDMIDAPTIDHAGEPWAAIAEQSVAIDGGVFSLAIGDAEGRFNLNNLMTGDVIETIRFQDIAKAAGLTEDQVVQAIALVRTYGPISDIRPLRQAGIDPAASARLETMVTALPGRTTINVNSVSQELLAILINNPELAQRVISVRERDGALTLENLTLAGASLPEGVTITSGSFWVRTRVAVGDSVQQGASLIQRRKSGPDQQPVVAVVGRWRNASLPPGIPDLAADPASAR
ncbi:general secretion pathway protein GspK [Sphingomonas sp. CJ99]